MSIKILLTGGRAPATLHLARILRQNGCEVYSAESFPCPLTKASNSVKKSFSVGSPNENPEKYIRDLLEIAKREKIHLLIPTCEEIFHISQHLSMFDGVCAVFCDSIEKMNMLHNKFDFIQCIKPFTENVPKTALLSSGGEWHEWEKTSGKKVLKPVYSRFSSRVSFVDKNDDFPFLEIKEENPWIVQEYIHGRQFCCYCIAVKGRISLFSLYETVYTAGAGATVHFQPSHHQGIFEWVKILAFSFSFHGQLSFDFIVDEKNEFFPIECNPRLTSGIHLFSEEENIADCFKGVCSVPLTPSNKSASSISLAMILYGWRTVKNRKDFLKWLRAVFFSKDVIFSWNDWKPFFYQFYSYCVLFRNSRKSKKSLMEETTGDIEWNGFD